MRVEVFPLGDLAANCYLLHDDGEAVVIDPADDGVFIAEKIHESRLKLKAILATHGHFDHVLGAGELQAIMPASFWIHEKDEFLLKQTARSAEFWLKRKILTILPADVRFFKSDIAAKFGKYILKMVETPGHTPGSVCFYLERATRKKDDGDSILVDGLFVGDTMFRDGVGRCDFAYADCDALKKSVKKILNIFEEETPVYPGHGETTTLSREKFLLQNFFKNGMI